MKNINLVPRVSHLPALPEREKAKQKQNRYYSNGVKGRFLLFVYDLFFNGGGLVGGGGRFWAALLLNSCYAYRIAKFLQKEIDSV